MTKNGRFIFWSELQKNLLAECADAHQTVSKHWWHGKY